MRQRVVVVGAGLGGLRTAEALRKQGYEGDIVVVGQESVMPYNRPPLSKEALAGGVDVAQLAFPLRSVLGEVDWRLGRQAVAADLDQRSVTLSDETTLEFDGLVVATGLRPVRLPLPGPPATNEAGRHVLRTVDDAVALRAALRPGVRLVVLGAGFIGSEVAATARGLGCDVTCVALDPLPMLRPLGQLLGEEMRRRHEARGVRFRLGTGVTRLLGEEHVTGVVLTSGEELAADVVVEAVGSRCNVEWLADTGLDLVDGVACDDLLRAVTTGGEPVDGVHAVGDVARFPNLLFDDVPRRVEHWAIPTDTGRRAGAALARHLSGEGYQAAAAQAFAPVPSFWSDQYDIQLQSYGAPDLADGGAIGVLEGELDGEVVVGYEADGRLVGVVSLGLLERVHTYRPLIGGPLG